MKNKQYILILTVFIFTAGVFMSGCASQPGGLLYDLNTDTGSALPYPNASFAVISDVHIFDDSLGTNEATFVKLMETSNKLFPESIPFLEAAINEIIASKVKFVLISGDLTKDGEQLNHQVLSERLKRLTDANIAVYVTPGNHDVNSGAAFRYLPNRKLPVPMVTAGEFAEIYADYGYKAAIMRDNESLSYVAEPVEGLWLLSVDACRHRDNNPRSNPHTSGRIRQRTLDWITHVLYEAHIKKKAVMVLMHHGIVEHIEGQAERSKAFLVNDYINFGKFLSSWNVRAAFTGHYHIQSIARADYSGKFIYDIQTASLVTPPCSIRYVNINNNTMNINSHSMLDRLYPGTDYADNVRSRIRNIYLNNTAKSLKGKCSDADFEIISNARADADTAAAYGEKDSSKRKRLDISMFGTKGRSAIKKQLDMIEILWKDIPPEDNNVSLKL